MAGYFDRHWYKDLMDVKRLQDITVGNITKQEWIQVYNKIPCKMYRTSQATLDINSTSGSINENNSVAYNNKYKLQAGDELIIYQYGELDNPERYIYGKPKKYKEPFGGVTPDLEHTQVSITLKSRVINKGV